MGDGRGRMGRCHARRQGGESVGGPGAARGAGHVRPRATLPDRRPGLREAARRVRTAGHPLDAPGAGRRGGEAGDRAVDLAPARGALSKKVALRPHKVRYWLNSPDKAVDPAEFERRSRAVCETCAAAPELHRRGTHTVSTDEKTGMQALERAAATLPMKPGLIERQEADYVRHGTQALTA